MMKKLFNRISPFIERIRLIIARYKQLFVAGGIVFLAVLLFVAIQLVLGPDEPVTTYTLPYTQNFDDVNLRRWYTANGVWTIRDGTLAQTVGGEELDQLHIPLKLPEDVPYHISTFITLKKGTKAAGLVFNSQYPELSQKQQRVYLQRPDKDTLQLVAGYLDETGSFVPQAEIPLSLNTEEFRLDLFVYENTYLVQVNGQRIIEKRPLFYKNGMVGFYSVGAATFDTFKLTVAENEDPGDMVYSSDFDQEPGGAGWVPFSGDWRVSEGRMLQNDATVHDAGIGYEVSTFQNYVLQATFNQIDGAGAGVLFNMPSPYQINGAHLVRYSDEIDALLWGYYDGQAVFTRQGFVELPAPSTDEHTIKVYSGENSYDIYLDDKLIARDIPLMETRGHIGLITSLSTAGFSNVDAFPLFGQEQGTVEPLTPLASVATATPAPASTTPTVAPTSIKNILPAATPLLASDPLIHDGGNGGYQGVFTGDITKSGWKAINGSWAFTEGNLVQPNAQGSDFAIVYQPEAFRNYSLTVGLSHLQDSGGGLLFNMPYADRLNGAHLVRYSDNRPDAIFWGYFDDTGKFVGEGYADVPAAGSDHHVLQIISKSATYDIYLDGKLTVRDLPLQQNYGHIGLLASNSSVSYDQVDVADTQQSSTSQSVANGVDALSNLIILSGKWDMQNGVLVQKVPDAGDYIINSGVYTNDFTIEARISVPKDSEVGGGFIFNMPDRGSRKGAYILRLINGGEGLFWGYYDSTNKFQGVGSATLQPADAYVVILSVTGDLMSVTVNGSPIASDVKLNSKSGWLGLLAYGGEVKFENLQVTYTETTEP
ncbi:MAG: hypothetical protein U0V02_10220 [Anaerolineales bacterium]